MFRLNLASGPYWLPLAGGVEVEVRPFGTEVTTRVRDEMPGDIRDAIIAGGAGRSVGLIKAFARASIVAWKGVGMADSDEDVQPWPEGIDALMESYPFGEAFERAYVVPALLLAAEKNASAPSPNGTSAAAQPIVQPAPNAATSALIA